MSGLVRLQRLAGLSIEQALVAIGMHRAVAHWSWASARAALPRKTVAGEGVATGERLT